MFTHLHVHTEYSMLDGLSRIEPLVARAKELNMHSLAITDHGGLYGAIDFYRTANTAGVKPIIGCEMYVAPGSRHDKGQRDKSPYHITILAKNLQGYGNLVKLVTLSHLEGFYYKPRVDRELLQRHHEGLIVLSGCPSGEVPQLIAQGRMDEAAAAATWYRELFGDYYLELMEHGGVDELPAINKGLLGLHRDLELPVVATNDSHYVHREEAPLQDILICIHTNTNVQDRGRLRMTEDSYYLKSPEEIGALYADLPEAISNTQVIADMCDLELGFSQLHLPQFKVPEGLDADGYLTRLCREGLGRRIPNAGPEDEQRLVYELEVIKQTRFANYFLVAWDIAQFARDSGILFAVRGSAAASLSLYCLGVTDVNPMAYKLTFERLLNVERKEMPDIDMDFQDDRREEVINYVVSTYGREHVAQIITFGTLGARASIRDVGRALAMPYADVDRIARLVPARLHIPLDEALQESPELKEAYGADDSVEKLVDTARGLEGTIRHSSTHAAGLVISDQQLDTYVPLQKPIKGDDEGITMTQYAMEPVAALGLLKIDILGLANLTILAKTIGLISDTQSVQITLTDIPLDDSSTFELLSRGDTVGVFQLEGAGMTRHIKELKPTSLGDVAAMIALYRPGPMEHISTFIEAKHGRAEPQYPHPTLREILRETYGVIVYQEQVLLVAQAFAGYSLGEADTVRKAMGKKVPEIMAQERDKFIDGALKRGYSRDVAEEVFALIEPFAGYAFNKAHAVSYGLISYWTAYLKANFPEEYMVCLLNAFADNTEKLVGSVAECRRLRTPVLPPDINRCEVEFSIERQEGDRAAIRFGLSAIKNVGPAAVLPIIEARKTRGPFHSVEHMCREADMGSLNRKTLESLIKAGALDSFGSRGGLLEVVGRILSLAQSEARLRGSDQTSMFDLFGESVPTPLSHVTIPGIETPDAQRHAWEMELLGVDLSGSGPLQHLADGADSEAIVFRGQIGPEIAGKRVVLVGQVSAATRRLTREQKPYTLATLALLDGEIDVFVWEGPHAETQDIWQEGTLVTVVGNVRDRGDRVSISCVEAHRYTVPDEDHPTSGQQDDDLDSGLPEHTVATAPDTAIDGPPLQGPGEEKSRGHDGGERSPQGAPPVVQAAAVPRHLTLRIRETDRPMDDRRLLEDVRRLLLEHRGEDTVSLEIGAGGHIVALEWEIVRVNVSSQLELDLQQLLGTEGHVSIVGRED